MNKPCTVIISGRPPGQNLVDIEVPPGSTALDVLQAVGLDRNWTLSREGSAQTFAFEETVYDAIEPGSKLRAAPLAEVGWLGWLRRIFGRTSDVVVIGDALHVSSRPDHGDAARRVRLTPSAASQPLGSAGQSVITRRAAPASAGPSGRLRVERDRRSVMEARGWRREKNRLLGAYRLGRRGAFAGEIDLSNRYRPRFFIVAPPRSVLEGSHGACFRQRSKDRYEIHFGIASPEPDAGILAIEKLLLASIGAALGKGNGR